MENIVIILCSLSFFALSLILLKKRQSRIILSIDNIVIVFFIAVSSILFPLDYFYSKYSNTNGKMLDIISKFESIEIILYYFAVVLFLIPFVFCFRWVEKKKMVSEGIVFEGEIKHSNTFIIGLFLLIIGFTADFLFLQSYGGYSSFLNY